MKAKGLQKLLSCKVATCLGHGGTYWNIWHMPSKHFQSLKWREGSAGKRCGAARNLRLRWYCQMCQKQCRDENGFKCHRMSVLLSAVWTLTVQTPANVQTQALKAFAEDGHQRQMQLFVQDPNRFMDEFSQAWTAELGESRRAHWDSCTWPGIWERLHAANESFPERLRRVFVSASLAGLRRIPASLRGAPPRIEKVIKVKSMQESWRLFFMVMGKFESIIGDSLRSKARRNRVALTVSTSHLYIIADCVLVCCPREEIGSKGLQSVAKAL